MKIEATVERKNAYFTETKTYHCDVKIASDKLTEEQERLLEQSIMKLAELSCDDIKVTLCYVIMCINENSFEDAYNNMFDITYDDAREVSRNLNDEQSALWHIIQNILKPIFILEVSQ